MESSEVLRLPRVIMTQKNTDKSDQQVDALAGATITGDGLSAMLKKDIKMYVPYFKSINN